jgi:hypothetical protein
MSKISVTMFTPLWRGKTFVDNFTDDMNTWSHTTRAIGGYWQAAVARAMRQQDLSWWLENGLGCHVVARNSALVTVWEGFVNSMTFNVGRFSYTLGPMMDLINRSSAFFSDESNSTGHATSDRTMTDPYEDRAAQKRFGIIEQMLSSLETDEGMAWAAVKKYVDESAWPRPIHTIEQGGGSVMLSFELYGYVRLLERGLYHNVSEAGSARLDQKIHSVLVNEPNQLFNIAGVEYTKDLISNGSFEILGAGGADVFADWTENAGTGAIAVETAEVYAGKRACKFTTGASNDTYIYQNVTVEPGVDYCLRVQVVDTYQHVFSGTHDGGVAGDEVLYDSAYNCDYPDNGSRLWKRLRPLDKIRNDTSGVEGFITERRYHGGLIWARHGVREGERIVWYNPITWDPGDAYTIWAEYGSSRYGLYDVTNARWLQWRRSMTFRGQADRFEFKHVFTAPPGCVSLRVYIVCPIENTAVSYYDDVSLRTWVDVQAEDTYTSVYPVVPKFDEEYRAPLTVIREALGYGSGNYWPCNWGIYADRMPRLEVVPATVTYIVDASDSASRYRTFAGQSVDDCDVLPGRWLKITGLIPGATQSDPRKDPSCMFIDEVNYSAAQGVSLNPGKFSTLKQYLARLGLQEL